MIISLKCEYEYIEVSYASVQSRISEDQDFIISDIENAV